MLENNRLLAVSQTSFKKENQTERQNLQEWIANASDEILKDIFNEELLIIQKEFAGFEDTKERLDLLALDKYRRLVIIENKTDDSGKDVTWQAIKYASYCSTLSTEDIIKIFAEYKFKGNEDSAKNTIKNFLGSDSDDNVELNIDDNSPRIFLVAAKFRKEVTSSVLWLSKFGLQIKCFEVKLFEHNRQVLIDFDQIIPIPKDVEDYTIKMAKKSQEAVRSLVAVEERKKFWIDFIDYNNKNNGLYDRSSSLKDYYLSRAIGGISGISVNVVVNSYNCRIELYFSNSDKDKNKRAFDFYAKLDKDIQSEMTDLPPLIWERFDDKVTCRIKSEKHLSYIDPNERNEVIKFLTNGSKRFLEVFSKYTDKVKLAIANS